MQLPNDEIGISDILDFRECPQRFAFSMRRHVPLPERFQIDPGEKDEPPEKVNWTNAYGSAVHEAIAVVERESVDDEEAIDRAWLEYQHYLEPDDIDRMRADLETYHTRTTLGFRLIANEEDMRVPLFVHEGRQIYFRFKIDALYQRIDNEAIYLTRDYKSSRWPKSEAEIHKDPQQWAYNWGLHEMFPEMSEGKLIQQYDMLRFGVTPTSKNAQQRARIKAWLIRQVKTILNDERLKPRSNQWCYTCPIMLDCRVTHRSADFWKNRLAALAPEKKDGRKIVVTLTTEHAGFEVYTELLPKVKEAAKVMERYIKAVEEVLKEMPAERRREFGFDLGGAKRLDVFSTDVMRRMHAELGDDFYHLVRVTKKAAEDFYGKDSAEYLQLMALAEKKQTAPSIKALKS